MNKSIRIGLLLAAGGSGSRFGSSQPKQFIDLDGKPVFLHALEPFLPFVNHTVIVVPTAWEEGVKSLVRGLAREDLSICGGGASRQESVWNGLRRLAGKVTHVLVHDAARPHVSADLIERVLVKTLATGACLPVLPLRDTIKEVSQGRVSRTLPRETLGLAQTPQGFEMSVLLRAFEAAWKANFSGTDEASLVERIGVPVHTVPGSWRNIKLTWTHDLDAAERVRLSRADPGGNDYD